MLVRALERSLLVVQLLSLKQGALSVCWCFIYCI